VGQNCAVIPGLKALLFDVQGTATDFHTTVRTEAARIGADRYPNVDWSIFVNRWRAAYFDALTAAPKDPERWTTVASVYRRSLDALVDEFELHELTVPERDDLALAWQRLQPWPDTVEGLTRLRSRFTIATLSNADVSAVVGLSKLGGLPWDAVFTAEMARTFKPDPPIYRMAATYLGLEPSEIMMVASHKYDIRAAAQLGFRTAFVARPLEFGVGGEVDTAYDDEFDVNAADFLDLAEQLGQDPVG
jgi:2-haloacid dehalogenase